MKRFLLAVAATVLLLIPACTPAPVAEPQVVEAIAVVDTRGHIMSIVLVRDDGTTDRYDAESGKDPNVAIEIGGRLPDDRRYVVIVPCPEDFARGASTGIQA